MYYLVKCIIVLNLRDVLLRSENSKYHSNTNNNIEKKRYMCRTLNELQNLMTTE